MGKEAKIYLDNQYNTYYAGQTINGRIEYVFDKPKKVRGIKVNIRGEAKTFWQESKKEDDAQGKTVDVDVTHTGEEEYFTYIFYVLGNGSGGEVEIPAGTQVYNFSYTLPPVLPSSFEGEYGFIRYTIKVTLDRPWKFDQDTKMAFTVINPLDLNLNPSYKAPIAIQMEKTFGCFCCTSAPLSVDVRAPVSGYCPGQAIPVEIDVDNKSNVQVHLVKVFLRKIVTYRCTMPSSSTKQTKDVITTVQEGPAPAGSQKHYSIKLEIPSLPPSNLVNCTIIDLDYDIKVECQVSGAHFNLKDSKYVTIGTVPLVGWGDASPPTGTQPAVGPGYAPSAPSAPAPEPSAPAPGGWVLPGQSPAMPQPPPHQSLYPSLAQPVYAASAYPARTIHDKGDTDHTAITGPTNFAPYYPTYAVTQPPPLPQ